jgi:nitric oxide reductase subunit C
MVRISVVGCLLLVMSLLVYAISQQHNEETSIAEVSRPLSASEELLQKGVEIYKQYYCGVCHAFSAADTKGQFGPPHDDLDVIAAARIQEPNYRGKATTAAEYVRESIVDPEAYIVPGYAATPHRMPAYTQLSEQELEALIHLLLQQ